MSNYEQLCFLQHELQRRGVLDIISIRFDDVKPSSGIPVEATALYKTTVKHQRKQKSCYKIIMDLNIYQSLKLASDKRFCVVIFTGLNIRYLSLHHHLENIREKLICTFKSLLFICREAQNKLKAIVGALGSCVCSNEVN